MEEKEKDFGALLGLLLDGVLSATSVSSNFGSKSGCRQLMPLMMTGSENTHPYHHPNHMLTFDLLKSFSSSLTTQCNSPLYWFTVSALLCGCPLCGSFTEGFKEHANFLKATSSGNTGNNSKNNLVTFDKNKLAVGLSLLLNAQQIGRLTLRALLLMECAQKKKVDVVKVAKPEVEKFLKEEKKEAVTFQPSVGGKNGPHRRRGRKRRLSRRQLAAYQATLDTFEVVNSVRRLLLQHSIGQRLFGAAVLGLSQGSVSQLLADPKPWEELNYGREPYIRMNRWLEALPRSMTILQQMKVQRFEGGPDQVYVITGQPAGNGWASNPSAAFAHFWSHFELEECVVNEDKSDSDNEVDDGDINVEDSDGGDKMVTLKKRPRRRRHRYTEQQLDSLNAFYSIDPRPRPLDMQKIAEQLELKYRQIDAWFHNTRVRGAKLLKSATSVSTSASDLTSISFIESGRCSVELPISVDDDSCVNVLKIASSSSSNSPNLNCDY